MTDIEATSKAFWCVDSPDGRIRLTLTLANEGSLTYSVLQDEHVMIEPSPLGLSTSVADFREGMTYLSHTTKTVQEAYDLIGGKTSKAVDHYNELTLKFRKQIYELHVILRAYDDGIAYRYKVPGTGAISIYGEASAFKMPDGSTAWAHDFVEHYEAFYPARKLNDMAVGDYGMPVLFHHPDGRWSLVSEAAVYGETGASHLCVADEQNGCLLRVVPAPDQSAALLSHRPFETAWRAVIVSVELAGIVASNLMENLNPASEISDTSWIQPGRSAWSWWSGDSTSDLDVQKRYVDFAARMGWEYYLCDGGWQEAWLPELLDYAKGKDVRLFVWSHHQDLQTDDEIESKLSRWAAMGVAGVKVDFFESDSQDKLRLYDKLAIETAKRQLLLNYHGCTKPSGERRRWPHLVTREGVLGAEYYKWSLGATAEHNCTLPFTRNVVGPMDYTPVTYSNYQGQTTFAHQTALCIVFESSVQHFADSVDSYETLDAPVLKLFQACPATWDETRLLEGYPGRYVTIARRKGDDWFIGAICGGEARSVRIPLSFLTEGAYVANVIRDGDKADQMIHQEHMVDPASFLEIPLLVNGGCAVWVVAK
ncbi:glycoside hydrolase family 97 protein [Alicyclobacillus fodiniaquatilis]|uniref:Glycoside hydrolase family 97 catalytic domain-containing protein n=1 Tax=Alicyclobacillus fodiniaquatilis TaxID=1661150 RepID=A0ABW4JFE7_9BACL